MSSNYKNELDKITVSDELKSRITAAAKNKIAEKSSKPIYSAAFYIRTVAGVAACAAAVFIGVLTCRTFVFQDKNPPQTNEPKQVASVENKTAENNTDFNEPDISKNDDLPESESTVKTPPKNITDAAGQNPDTDIKYPESNNEAGTTEDNPAAGSQNESNIPGDDDFLETGGAVMTPGFDDDDMTVGEICDSLGYRIAVPNYLPDGYKKDSALLMFDSLVQIEYSSADDTLVYRTEKTDEDISGDHNEYEYVETHRIHNADVMLKGTGKGFCLAVWNSNGSSYSLSSKSAIDRDVMIKIIENIK